MTLDQFATAHKASIDSAFGLADQAFQGAEQLTALNLKTLKTMLADSQESSEAALAAKSPAELLKLQSDALQAAPKKALAYGREVQEILSAIGATQRSAFEAQVADAQAKFLDSVDGAFKSAPGGEHMIALAKSAVAGANNAYEGATKASKQVADTLAANVAKATEAGETVVKSTRRAAKA